MACGDSSSWLLFAETEAAKQQLLLGALALLGAPLSLASSAASNGADEIWQAAAWVGAPQCSDVGASCGGVVSVGGLPPPSWAAQVLAGGNWAWLHCSSISSGSGMSPSPALREHRWYREHPSRRSMLLRLLAALTRGPCQAQPAVAAALLDVASDAATDEGQPEGGRQRQQQRDWGAARELAKQLLACQRENLVLWQAYAELERRAGAAKAARRVYAACLAGAAAATTAAAAPLALSAACFELERGGGGAAGGLLGGAAAALDSAAAAALRLLAWLGSSGAVPATASLGGPAHGSSGGGGGGGPALAPLELVAARRGFQNQLLALVQRQRQARQRGGAVFSPTDAAMVSAAAAFELLAGRLAPGSLAAGVKAGLAVYDQALATLLPPSAQQQQQQAAGQQRQQEQWQERGAADPLLEQLCLQWCSLAAEAARARLPAASPAAARAALACALAAFPASPGLLQLQAAHELAGHTVAALRRTLLPLAAGRPSTPAWLALLAVEVRTHAPASAVRAALERAVSSVTGRSCPLLWRLYLRWEAAGGRPEAVHRVFLRAVGACPGSKAVWTDGLALLNGTAPPKELTGEIGDWGCNCCRRCCYQLLLTPTLLIHHAQSSLV